MCSISVLATLSGPGARVKSIPALAGVRPSRVDPGATLDAENARSLCRTFPLEGMKMDDSKRTAERNAGASLPPDLGGGGGVVPVPVDLDPGTVPGKPEPEDEWKIPAWPEDELEAGAKAGGAA